MGNVNDVPLAALWGSAGYVSFRERVAELRLPSCPTCDDYLYTRGLVRCQ